MEKILVIGLGSMGKRRIRLIHRIKPEIEIIGIDARADRRADALALANENDLTITAIENISEIKKSGDIIGALICTSPVSHADIIKQCLDYGFNIFSEINLIDDGYDENIKTANQKNLLLYLSSTPMFRKEVKYITENVRQNGNKLNYIFHVGQYLPDWHPWESYKDFFISNSRTNGCREILSIELPWLVRCFGKIKKMEVSAARQTSLDIDFKDSYNIILEHENGNRGVFVVDVVCRFPVRYFEVAGENLFITWNGKPDGLRQYDIADGILKDIDVYKEYSHRDGYNAMIIEDAYEEELRDFFLALSCKKKPEYTFKDDRDILKWIDEVEKCNH